MVNIAVIDDEPKIRRGITAMLRQSFDGRARVYSFEATSQVIKFAGKEMIDILITDICMPDMDGLELGNYLKLFNPELKIIIISGYSNFEYAKAAISLQVCEYLLKPVDQEKLLEIVEKNTALIEKKQYQTYDAGSDVWDSHFIMASMLYGGKESAESKETASYFLALTQGEKEDGYLFGDKVWHSGKITAKRRFYLFKESVPKSFETYIFQTEDVCAGISEQCRGASMLHMAYIQAEAALKQQLYDETDSGVWYFKSGGIWQFDGSKKAVMLVNTILGQGSCRQVLSEIEEEIRKARPVYPMLEKNMRAMLEEIIRLTGSNAAFTRAQLMLKKIGSHMEDYQSLSDIFADIAKALGQILEASKETEDLRMKQHIQAALDFIGENFERDLSLDEVAEHANLNAAYFSSYFKKMTGQSFVNYITELRVRRAKELLRDEHIKIGRISEMLGFNDTRYFAKIFKKYVGVTPSEYRGIIQKMKKNE